MGSVFFRLLEFGAHLGLHISGSFISSLGWGRGGEGGRGVLGTCYSSLLGGFFPLLNPKPQFRECSLAGASLGY